MIPDLPTSLLRTFVAVVDCGSLAAAAQRIARSESALSLQIAKLEGIVGQALFDRDGRALRLNRTGGVLLAHSRSILGRIDSARAELAPERCAPVRIGVVQDFVAGVLRPTLADVLDATPQASFSLVIASTAELLQAIGEDRIDAALCAGEPFGASVVTRLPMRWFGHADLLRGDVVPLVGITPPCPFLLAAQRVLDAAGRPWRVVLSTPSLDGVRASVEAGLGITCRTEVGLGLAPLCNALLPQLPHIAYSIVERRHGDAGSRLSVARLRAHLESMAGVSAG